MTAIKFRCECGKSFSAANKHAGKKTSCPACRRSLIVPDQACSESTPETSNASMVRHYACAVCGRAFGVEGVVNAGGQIVCRICYSREQPASRMSLRDRAIVFTSFGAAAVVVGTLIALLLLMPQKPLKPGHRTMHVELAAGNTPVGATGRPQSILLSSSARAGGQSTPSSGPTRIESLKPPVLSAQGYFKWERGRETPVVGILVSIHSSRFVASEEEFARIQKKHADRGDPDRLPPSRQHVRVYSPERFTLVFDNGSTRRGDFFAELQGGELLGISRREEYNHKSATDDDAETLAVCWKVASAKYKPPFRIRIDDDAAVSVPDKTVSPPKSSIPKLEIPKFDIPKFDMPNFETPRIRIPGPDLPRINALRERIESEGQILEAIKAHRLRERPGEPRDPEARKVADLPPETRGRALLQLAENYRKAGLPEKEKQYLQQVIDKFAGLECAREAKKRLDAKKGGGKSPTQ